MPDHPQPPIRRSTHVQVAAEEAGTSLVEGSEVTTSSRADRRTTPPATSSIPAFTGAASGSGAARTPIGPDPRMRSLSPTHQVMPATETHAATGPVEVSAPRRRRRVAVMAMSATIVVLLSGLGFVTASIAANVGDGGSAHPADPDDDLLPIEEVSFPEDAPAAAPGEGPCTVVHVLASLENAEMVANLAEGYNAQPRDVDGRCVSVTTAKDKSGVAATRAAGSFDELAADKRPTVWLPDSTSWLASATSQGADAVPAEGTSVAQTGLVLAMPAPLAFATGWYNEAPTWDEVFDTADREDFWSQLGHPEWGTFKLGKTSPLVATSGEAALLASFGAAGSGFNTTTLDEFADPRIVAEVTRHELSTSHYMATPEHFLWHAREADMNGSSSDYLSAVIVDEKSVWDYNRGMISHDGVTTTQGRVPHDELVAIYPTDGVFVADNPAVVLDGDWVDEQERAAAADFIRFAGTAQGQKIVVDSGYRDLAGRLAPTVQDIGILPRRIPGATPMPEAEVIAALQDSFSMVRKRAAVLFLVDTSGSMKKPIAKGQTKLDAAKSAIVSALGHFSPGDAVGLAAFSSDGGDAITPGMVTPVIDVAENRDALVAGVQSLQAQSYTPLYLAVSRFTRDRVADFAPDRVNAVVLLSDGANETTVPTISKEQMLKDLNGIPAETPVMVFTLAYGESADIETLKQIAAATGSHFYDASDPTEVSEILGELITSF